MMRSCTRSCSGAPQVGRSASSSARSGLLSVHRRRSPYLPASTPPNTTISLVDRQAAGAEAAALDAASACPVLRQLKPIPEPLTRNVWKNIQLTLGNPINSTKEVMGDRDVSSMLFMGAIQFSNLGSVAAVRDALLHEQAGRIKAVLPPAAEKLLGEESISAVTGVEQHRALRKHLATVLGPDAVDDYLPEITQIVNEALDDVVSRCQAGNQPVPIMPVFKNMTLRVICRVVLDLSPSPAELQRMAEDFHVYVKHFFAILPYDVWPLPFHASMDGRRSIVRRIRHRVEEVREAISKDPSLLPRSAIKRLLLARDDQGQGLTDKQLEDNLVQLLFAGHDSTASHLTRVLWDLSLHPHVVNKLRLEQERVIRTHGPAITAAALADMEFAQAVSTESFRLSPIIPGSIRLTQEDVDVQGYLVPKNTVVVYEHGFVAQNDPRWPAAFLDSKDPLHPHRFNPDRFMLGDGTRVTGAQSPFGAGPRMCAGVALANAEIKLFLAQLVRNYDWVVDVGGTRWDATPSVAIHPLNGLPVWMERRGQQQQQQQQ